MAMAKSSTDSGVIQGCLTSQGTVYIMNNQSGRDASVKVNDEVFIATALLHREHPEKADFSVSEIVERARRLNGGGELRPGVRVHASVHSIANRPPSPARLRTLYATAGNRRRILLAGDDVHPERKGAIFPESLPPQFAELLVWAKQRYKSSGPEPRWLEGILGMAGMGRELWKREDPDEYVRRLRQGWE
jgi:hypothetical protein